jgi:hypothetical protein
MTNVLEATCITATNKRLVHAGSYKANQQAEHTTTAAELL